MNLKPQTLFNRAFRWQAIVLFLMVFQCVLLLVGCGFHLRGSANVVEKIDQVIYVQADDLHSTLMTSLEDDLNLTHNRDEAQSVLTIVSENRGRRVLSVASDGKVEEYELQYVVTFSATDASSSMILPQQSVTLKRTYQFDETAVLAIETEESDLYQSMADDAARQISRRLDVAITR